MIEILSVVLNAVLGGGLIVSLVTLRSVRRKAAAESKKAELENAEQPALSWSLSRNRSERS